MDVVSRAARRSSAATAGAIALSGLLLLPVSGAHAQTAPQITAGPAITGVAQVGAILTARGTWNGDPAPATAWEWLRCPALTGQCRPIPGATSATYVPEAATVGSVLRVRLLVTNSAGSDERRSLPTLPVLPALVPTPPTPPTPPIPSPTATATPTASPVPTATPTPTGAATPTPTPAPRTFDVVAAPVAQEPSAPGPSSLGPKRPPMLKPFPVVRLKGAFIPVGARLSLFTVTAPRGARVTVSCRGRDCPRRRFVPRAGVKRLRLFERNLRAGTRLEVTITKAGHIGKYTSILIRRGAPPRRSDRCLMPDSTRPVPCPAK